VKKFNGENSLINNIAARLVEYKKEGEPVQAGTPKPKLKIV
jgi:hypothetical protein